MTLSDLDLETRLRQQRTRADEVAPLPLDLVERVRVRAREQRRRRVVLAAAGVAAALVFVGVPVLASGLVGEDSGSEAAASSSRRPSANYVPPLDDLPTRGSLADDADWVEAVRGLSWRSSELEEGVPADFLPQLPDPPGERHVAFAGDVPGGRVALVLGVDDRGHLAHAWFAGPARATPDDLTLAALPASPPSGCRWPCGPHPTPRRTSR